MVAEPVEIFNQLLEPIQIKHIEAVELPNFAPVAIAPFNNCYLFVKNNYFNNLPPTNYIQNHLQKSYGEVAVFYYAASGLWHYAKTTSTLGDTFIVDEANYKAGYRTQRTISIDDPNLKGFFNP